MRRSISKQMLAAKFCLLLLGALLLLAACGDYQQNPSPNSTPSNGYSIIYVLDHGMQMLLTLPIRLP